MNKKIFLFYITIVSLALITGSCSEPFEPQPQTYSQLLTGTESKTWRLASIELIEGKSAPYSFSLPLCITDDQYVFHAGDERLYQVYEGATRCENQDEDYFLEDTWLLINATATLHIVFPLLADVKLPYIIKRLTETNLTIEIYFDEDEDGSSSYRMQFISPKT